MNIITNDPVPAIANHILQQLLQQVQQSTAAMTHLRDKPRAMILITFEMTAVYNEVILRKIILAWILVLGVLLGEPYSLPQIFFLLILLTGIIGMKLSTEDKETA